MSNRDYIWVRYNVSDASGIGMRPEAAEWIRVPADYTDEDIRSEIHAREPWMEMWRGNFERNVAPTEAWFDKKIREADESVRFAQEWAHRLRALRVEAGYA